MRFYVTFTLILFSLGIKSQTWINVTTDYINNPSFEDYTSCPQNTSDPFNYWVDSCKYWSHVTYASPDYYNTCSNIFINPLFGVPYNYPLRYQLPYHGYGYLGFYAYGLINTNLWCEYVNSRLIKKLESGRKYKFEMRISPSKYNVYGITKIGVHLSPNSLSNNYQQTSFKFNPTMLNSKGIINDTTNWFLFEEEFTATGLENYITIGWYADTVTNDNGYIDTTFNQINYGYPYYAIDSINLLESKIKEFDVNVFTPNNDGVNDIIDFSEYNFKNLKFELYNRWGNLVFSTNDVNLKWGGLNDKSLPLSDGVYYYIIYAEIRNLKDKIEKKGYLTIIH